MQPHPQQHPLSLLGLVLGIVALGLAIFHFWLGPLNPPPPVETVIADQAVKIRQAVLSKLQGEETEATADRTTFDTDRVIDLCTVGSGFLAIVLGMAAFIRREDMRTSGSAAVLGSAAIAFQFLTIAIGTVIMVILIGIVLMQLGIDVG